MAVLGKVTVSLTARTAPFARGMKRAQGILGRFRAGIASSMRMLRRMGTVAVGAAVVGAAAFVWWQKSIFDSIDAQAKLADSLGITTEALAGLTHAGKIYGVANTEMADGLKMMSKNLGDAASGFGRAKRFLDVMGIEAKKLLKLAPEEQFALLADEISALPSAAQKASAALGIFGGSGLKLVNVLAIGSKGLKEMHKEAMALGLGLKRVDAAMVETANDAMTRLGELAVGTGQKIAVGLAPYVTAIAIELERVGTAAQDSLATQVIEGVEWTAEAIAIAVDAVAVLKTAFVALGFVVAVSLDQTATQALLLAKAMAFIADPTGLLGTGKFIKRLEGFQQELRRNRQIIGAELAEQAKSIGAAQDAVARRMEIIRSVADTERRAAEAAARAAALAAEAAGAKPAGIIPGVTGAARARDFGVGAIRYSVAGMGGGGKAPVQEVQSTQLETIAAGIDRTNLLLAGGIGAV